MPNGRQKRQIKQQMARIKQAQREGRSEEEIESRAQELYQYLISEGLIQPNE